jgi:hypothetical protein
MKSKKYYICKLDRDGEISDVIIKVKSIDLAIEIFNDYIDTKNEIAECSSIVSISEWEHL